MCGYSDGGVEVIPDLPDAWEVSDDGLVYTFHLRDGVMFHDGAELTSEDVKATLHRIIFPPVGMISQRQSVFLADEEVQTAGPLTVEFVLAEPRGFMPAAIANGWNVIERKRTLDDNNLDLKRVKPGTVEHSSTGPCILEDHQAASSGSPPGPRLLEPRSPVPRRHAAQSPGLRPGNRRCPHRRPRGLRLRRRRRPPRRYSSELLGHAHRRGLSHTLHRRHVCQPRERAPS